MDGPYITPGLGESEPKPEVASPIQELGPSWREESLLANAFLLALGVFLALTPFVVGNQEDANAWLDVAAGGAVAALALLRILLWHGAAWVGAFTGVIGIAVAIAALPLHDRPNQGRTVLITGVLIAIVSIWSAAAPARRRKAA
ncbi:MAG TPA: hypothetical protein VEY90_07260 [Thermoleophilaceae bacterium]|jgi:hypothetical protein|nr:hypothetical protein [Thermoleophilaceae bacterium]